MRTRTNSSAAPAGRDAAREVRRKTKSAEIEAAAAATHLNAIRRLLRESVLARSAKFPVALTAPQLLALEIIVDRLRTDEPAPSISELGVRLGLSHSTVSGIVDRLEQSGVVRRQVHPTDRRVTQIGLTPPAAEWVTRELPAARGRPLIAAFERADARERRMIVEGLAALEKLLAGGLSDAR